MTFKTLLFIVLGTLVTMATTWAQPAPDKSSAYFRTIGAGVAPTDLFYSDGGPKPVPVAVGVEGRSSYYRLPNRTKPLAFFRLSKGADGKDAYVPVAQVNLADLGRHSLMVFSRSLTEKNALVVTGLKDDAEAVPGGCPVASVPTNPAGSAAWAACWRHIGPALSSPPTTQLF